MLQVNTTREVVRRLQYNAVGAVALLLYIPSKSWLSYYNTMQQHQLQSLYNEKYNA